MKWFTSTVVSSIILCSQSHSQDEIQIFVPVEIRFLDTVSTQIGAYADEIEAYARSRASTTDVASEADVVDMAAILSTLHTLKACQAYVDNCQNMYTVFYGLLRSCTSDSALSVAGFTLRICVANFLRFKGTAEDVTLQIATMENPAFVSASRDALKVIRDASRRTEGLPVIKGALEVLDTLERSLTEGDG